MDPKFLRQRKRIRTLRSCRKIQPVKPCTSTSISSVMLLASLLKLLVTTGADSKSSPPRKYCRLPAASRSIQKEIPSVPLESTSECTTSPTTEGYAHRTLNLKRYLSRGPHLSQYKGVSSCKVKFHEPKTLIFFTSGSLGNKLEVMPN